MTVLIYERFVPAVPLSVPLVRHDMDGLLEHWRLLVERRGDALLAVSEAATNVVLHAYEDGRPGPLYAATTVDDRLVTLWIVDHGRGLTSPSDRSGAGMGLRLLAILADELRVQASPDEAGTCLSAAFRRDAADRRTDLSQRVAAVSTQAELLRDYGDLLAHTHARLTEETQALRAEARQALRQAQQRRRGARR
jgi:anti-sigma regulatory factor (Ser/Thr protein kinase)